MILTCFPKWEIILQKYQKNPKLSKFFASFLPIFQSNNHNSLSNNILQTHFFYPNHLIH